MRYLFHYLPTGTLPIGTYDLGDWLDRHRQTQKKKQKETEKRTDRNRQKQRDRDRKTDTKVEIHSRARGHDDMYILPPTIFTHVFSSLYCFFGNVRKKTRDDPKYMYLVRRVKSKSGAQKMSYFRDERKKRKVILVGKVGSGKICAILHVHYMHGGQRAFPEKKN